MVLRIDLKGVVGCALEFVLPQDACGPAPGSGHDPSNANVEEVRPGLNVDGFGIATSEKRASTSSGTRDTLLRP
jgi:hypothetical protein